MKQNSGPSFICCGFNKFFEVPKVGGERRMTLRTAVVIKKRDFFDGWNVYDLFFWRMIESVSTGISDKICIKVFDSGSKTFNTIAELRTWQKQQKVSDPEFDLAPPYEIEFLSEGYLVSLMRFEDWSDIVKHEPYACSFTFSFYSDNLKINAIIGEGLLSFLSNAPEVSTVTHVQEESTPKWYWPLMDRIKSTKFFIYGMFGLMALALAVVVCISPSPSTYNKIHHCRRFLQRTRYILLAIDNKAMDMTFIEWREARGMASSNEDLPDQICEYCEEYSSHAGLKMFRSQEFDGEHRLTDPWGQPYNVNLLRCFHDEIIRRNLKNYTVGGIIMWSSGPNGINDNGEDDDIFELPRNNWDIR